MSKITSYKAELLDSQYLFLLYNHIMGTTPLSYQLELNGNLSITHLKRALYYVMLKNPVLMSNFVLAGEGKKFSDYELIVDPSIKPPILMKDISDLESLSQTKLIDKEFQDLLNRVWDMHVGSLFAVTVFKCSDKKHCLLLGINHIILDGLSSIQFLDELFTMYEKLLQRVELPKYNLEYELNAYNKKVRRINSYEPISKNLESYKKSLNSIGKDIFFWNPKQIKNYFFSSKFKNITYKLDKQITTSLLNLTSIYKVSFYTIILEIYCDIFFQLCKKRLIFQLPTSGKNYQNVDMNNLMGCFAQAVTLVADENYQNLSYKEKLHYLSDIITNSLYHEHDHIQTKKMAGFVASTFTLENGKITTFGKVLARSLVKTNLYLSYTGVSVLKTKYGGLAIVSYKEGSNNNTGALDFMHTIFDGKLQISINYDEAFYDDKVINLLVSKIKEKLQKLLKITLVDMNKQEAKTNYMTNINKATYEKTATYLVSLLKKLFAIDIKPVDYNVDLEAGFGLDSLRIISFISEIIQEQNGKISPDVLLSCRSLYDFIEKMNMTI